MSRRIKKLDPSSSRTSLGSSSSQLKGGRCRNRQQQKLRCIEEEQRVFFVDPGQYETGSFASRCSLKLIYDVIAGFDSQKRDLVKSTGFEGILHFPFIKHINRKFSLWLMSLVEEDTCTLSLCQNSRIKFSKEDVNKVFGIPCIGKKVVDNYSYGNKAKQFVLQEYLGANFKEHRSIKVVQEVVQRAYVYPMSKVEEDVFRAAFTVFVVSTLLAPSAKHDYACVDYWATLEVPELISSFDWSEYVILKLVESVKKLKQDLSAGVKFPNVNGCSLFLQVLYLDSIDLDELSLPHDSFPRVRQFTNDVIRAFIRADRNYSLFCKQSSGPFDFKLRARSSCSYTWAQSILPVNEQRPMCYMAAIWEATVAMARLLNIPMEAAGPLFVAASNFQDQVESGVNVSGIRAINYISVLVSILLAFKNGYRYKFSCDHDFGTDGGGSSNPPISSLVSSGIRQLSNHAVKKRKLPASTSRICGAAIHCDVAADADMRSSRLVDKMYDDDMQNSIKLAVSSMEKVPDELNANNCLASVMSQFYSMVRGWRVSDGHDLSCQSGVLDDANRCGLDVFEPLTCAIPSPWELGYVWEVDGLTTEAFLSSLRCICDNERPIIMHRYPKHIKVSARSFREQILGLSEFELDLFDAFIRSLKQDDDVLYKGMPSARWRHFFESDFMVSLLAGCFDLSDSNSVHHFSATNMPYDIRHTKLIFFPALFQFRWVCYVWCISSNVIRVFDPSQAVSATEAYEESHARNCFLLKIAMQTVSSRFFGGWNHDWMAADVCFTSWIDRYMPGSNRSGAWCALFCSCFDGVDLSPQHWSVDADDVAARIGSDVIRLKGNLGTIPQSLQ